MMDSVVTYCAVPAGDGTSNQQHARVCRCPPPHTASHLHPRGRSLEISSLVNYPFLSTHPTMINTTKNPPERSAPPFNCQARVALPVRQQASIHYPHWSSARDCNALLFEDAARANQVATET